MSKTLMNKNTTD